MRDHCILFNFPQIIYLTQIRGLHTQRVRNKVLISSIQYQYHRWYQYYGYLDQAIHLCATVKEVNTVNSSNLAMKCLASLEYWKTDEIQPKKDLVFNPNCKHHGYQHYCYIRKTLVPATLCMFLIVWPQWMTGIHNCMNFFACCGAGWQDTLSDHFT